MSSRWKRVCRMYESVEPLLPRHHIHLPWFQYRYRGFDIMESGGHVIGGKVIPTMPDRSARVAGNELVASFDTRIRTEDAAHAEHFTTLKLILRGHRLSGPVYAESRGFHFWLPSYASLRRENGGGPTQAE